MMFEYEIEEEAIVFGKHQLRVNTVSPFGYQVTTPHEVFDSSDTSYIIRFNNEWVDAVKTRAQVRRVIARHHNKQVETREVFRAIAEEDPDIEEE